MKKSQIDMAIESLEKEMEVLQLAMDKLLSLRAGKPARVKKPKAVPSLERSA